MSVAVADAFLISALVYVPPGGPGVVFSDVFSILRS